MSTQTHSTRVRTEVQILGKTYTLRSDVDPTFARETATLVNTKMRELADKSTAVPTEKVAILTAMNLAGELLKSQKEASDMRDSLRKKTQKLLGMVKSCL